MATLTNQTIADSYEQLLSLPDGGGNGTNLVAVTDGDAGTTFDIELSSNSTNFKTDFQIGGSAVTSTAAELNMNASLDIDLTNVSGSDDSLASAKAIKTYVDSQDHDASNEAVGGDLTGTVANAQIASDVVGATELGVTAGKVEASKALVADSEKYVLGEQGRADHVANTMPAHYFRFDGSNDNIDITSSEFQNIFGSEIFSHEMVVKFDDVTTEQVLFSNNGTKYMLQVASGILSVNAHGWGVDLTHIVAIDKIYHILLVVDSTGTDYLYVNGMQVDSVNHNAFWGTATFTTANTIGSRTTDNKWFKGSIYKNRLHNHALSASEVKQLSSGASVPFKYKGASQTAKYTSDFSAGTDGWSDSRGTVEGNIDAIGTPSTDNTLRFTIDGTAGNHSLNGPAQLTVGIEYRITFDVYIPTGNTDIDGFVVGGAFANGIDAESVASANWISYSFEDIALSTSMNIFAQKGTSTSFTGNSTDVLYVHNLQYTQIGAVAEYDASGMSEEHWFDTSGNDLHGDVTGASLENQGDGGATKAITLTPRALPTTANASEGQIVYDSSANKLKVLTSSGWETITSST